MKQNISDLKLKHMLDQLFRNWKPQTGKYHKLLLITK